MEVGGSAPNLPNLHHFKAARDRPMTLEEAKLQMQEAKSLVDLIAEREKSEKKIRRVATIAVKLSIAPPPQFNAFELPPAEKKRKRRAELIHEVFVKENFIVDGMQRNLVPP
ncbi:hypothetical protein Tco_0651090 [Tanacetum coccineum]